MGKIFALNDNVLDLILIRLKDERSVLLAGLSYIDSQEPEESSQANALHFVDHFVSLNDDLGFTSPGIGNRKTTKVKSPPVTNTRGSHSLARMIKLGSQSEKAKAFEWADPEENGSLRFLDKKRASSFELGDRKENSDVARHQKVRHADDTKGESSSDGSKGRNIIRNLHKEMTESEGKIENGSDYALEEHLNAKPTGLQPEPCGVGGGVDDDMFDIGFNTQIAAEAMEALAYGDHPGCNTTDVGSGGATEIKGHLEHTSLQNSDVSNVGGINRNVKQRKCSTKISRRAGASYKKQSKKQELDPDSAAVTKVKRNSADANESLRIESPKPIKKRKLESAADYCKNYASVSHQTTRSMPGVRSKRTEDGSNNPGVRMNKVVENGIVTYRRKKKAHPSEIISGAEGEYNVPIERKSNVQQDDIITYRRKKGTGAKESCSKVYVSSEGDNSRKTCSLELGLWNHPKRKRTRRNARSNSCRATLIYTPFALVDGKDSPSNYDEGPENSNNMKGKSQSLLYSDLPQLSSNNNSDSCLLELQPSKVDGTDPTLSVSECTAPSNSTTGIKGSSKHVSHDYHKKPCNKNLPKSSLLKELIGLGVPESMPDFAWKDLRRRRNMAYVRVLFSQHLDDDIIKQQKKVEFEFV